MQEGNESRFGMPVVSVPPKSPLGQPEIGANPWRSKSAAYIK
jgi:hypothetical protein